MENTIYPRWATKKEAADHARCSEALIARHVEAGRLTRAGHDRKVLVDLNELDALLLTKEPYETPWMKKDAQEGATNA